MAHVGAASRGGSRIASTEHSPLLPRRTANGLELAPASAPEAANCHGNERPFDLWPLSQFRHPWCPTTAAAAATVSGARGCPNDVHIHKLSLTHTFAPAPHSHHPHLPPTSSRDSPRHCQPKAKRPILISKTTRGQTRRDSGIAHNTKREKAGTTGVWRGSVIVVPSPKIRLPCPPGLRNSRPSAGHGLSPPSTAPARS